MPAASRRLTASPVRISDRPISRAALSTVITGTPGRSSSNSSAAEFARTRGEPACVAQAGGGVSVGEDPGEALVDSFAPGLGQVAGNVGDAQAAPDLIADEPAGTDVLGDSVYGSGEFRNHLNQRGMTATIKPGPTARRLRARSRSTTSISMSMRTR